MAELNPPLEVVRGLPFDVGLRFVDEAETVINLTGWELRAFIGPVGGTARITKSSLTSGSGIAFTTASAKKGLATFRLTAAETAALKSGDGYAIKRLRSGSDAELLDEAAFTLRDTLANEVAA